MDVNGFSLESVFRIRAKAFSQIRQHASAIEVVGAAVADMDAALQTAIAEHNIDDQQALLTTARQLAAVLDGGQG